MAKERFFICRHCGNIFDTVIDGGVTAECCGSAMELLTANSQDAAQEKHVPFIERDGKKTTVKVGSVPHPMLPEHYIQFIHVVQGDKIQRVALRAGNEAKAEFVLDDANAPIRVYEYCNLHGLWVAEA